jgi:hypothetical protein
MMTFWLRGAVPFFQGHFPEASVEWRKMFEFAPGNPLLKAWAAPAIAYGGDIGASLDLLAEPELPEGDDVGSRLCRIQNCALQGDREGALNAITPAFRQTVIRDGGWAWLTAAPLAFVGAVDEAFEWLEYAVSRGGFINYPMLAEHDPFLTKLRGRPEYETLLERVKKEWEKFEV